MASKNCWIVLVRGERPLWRLRPLLNPAAAPTGNGRDSRRAKLSRAAGQCSGRPPEKPVRTPPGQRGQEPSPTTRQLWREYDISPTRSRWRLPTGRTGTGRLDLQKRDTRLAREPLAILSANAGVFRLSHPEMQQLVPTSSIGS